MATYEELSEFEFLDIFENLVYSQTCRIVKWDLFHQYSYITAVLIGSVVEQSVSSYTMKEINKLFLIACNLL